MKRVELRVRRLVVSGKERFDAEAFCDALRSEIGQRIREGSRVSSEVHAEGAPPQRRVPTSAGLAGEAARSVVGRLFK
jgi:hypothetical protein